MKRQISFRQYRAIDLGLFALLLLASEALLVTAATRWFPEQPYTVSVSAAVTAIVLLRWGAFAALHAALAGAVFCLASGAAPAQYAVYCLGNLLALLMLPLRRAPGTERIRNDAFLTVAFALGTQLLMQLGRALTAFLLGSPAARCLGFVTTDALSELFTALVLWVARRQDGLLEDQKHYLLRIRADAGEKGGGY